MEDKQRVVNKIEGNQVFQWTKRLDTMHYYKANGDQMAGTLCGKPMLGSNYCKVYPDRGDCEECLKEM